MTARVLVVDDVPANVKLLEAKLVAEYFDVITAPDGHKAIELAIEESPDIVLLDVMMPGLDGFEVCRRLKSTLETRHIPIIMVTALDQQTDRVRGLDAGADDFLTKPVDDVALFARLKSLVRLKMLTDELRLRHQTGLNMGLMDEGEDGESYESSPSKVLVVEDRAVYAEKISSTLGERHDVLVETNPESALASIRTGSFDLVIVSLSLKESDGLRLCSHIRSLDETRQVPIVVLVEEDDKARLIRALDIGVNDYVLRPIDRNELVARVRTQLRQKYYSEKLRRDLESSFEKAITDTLTGLYNRRYLESHLDTLIGESGKDNGPLTLLIFDIDYFKSVNDTHGHEVGDEVLKEFARRIKKNVRANDLACRIGGEEFVVVMPETDIAFAHSIAERLRQQVAEKPFVIGDGRLSLDVTVSIGMTETVSPDETSNTVLSRADQALYRAKSGGRNRVVAEAA